MDNLRNLLIALVGACLLPIVGGLILVIASRMNDQGEAL